MKAQTTVLIYNDSLHIYELDLTSAELKLVEQILNWLRPNEYGGLELKLNTLRDQSGEKQKVVDILPTVRQRIVVE